MPRVLWKKDYVIRIKGKVSYFKQVLGNKSLCSKTILLLSLNRNEMETWKGISFTNQEAILWYKAFLKNNVMNLVGSHQALKHLPWLLTRVHTIVFTLITKSLSPSWSPRWDTRNIPFTWPLFHQKVRASEAEYNGYIDSNLKFTTNRLQTGLLVKLRKVFPNKGGQTQTGWDILLQNYWWIIYLKWAITI